MAIEPQRAQTLSAVSTILSAFLVFVIGGGVVLKIWSDDRKQARALPPVEAAADPQPPPGPEAKRTTEQSQVRTSKTVSRPSRKQSVKQKVRAGKAAKASRATVSPTASSAVVTGKGQVVVAGDASRVRLIGSTGTFGSGTVPAGNYTIQATFLGGDPRMAGTVKVEDGQRIIIVCKSAGQSCVQR